MRRVRVALSIAAWVAAGWGAAGTAWAAGPDWATELAVHLAATPDQAWTNLDTPGRLAPVVGFNPGECATARAPGRTGAAPVESGMVIYDQPEACNTATRLLTLQLYLAPVAAAERARLVQGLTQASGRPCFTGDHRANPRSRAQPAHVTAWHLPAFVVAVVTQPELPDGLAVSVIAPAADPAPLPAGIAAARESLLNSLPASCR